MDTKRINRQLQNKLRRFVLLAAFVLARNKPNLQPATFSSGPE